MSWFKRPTPEFIPINPPQQRERIGRHVWHKCEGCGQVLRRKDWEANWKVCPSCNRHDRIEADERILLLVDKDSFEETDANMVSGDPLGFVDQRPYTERIEATRKKTGRNDAVISGRCTIGGVPTALAVMDFAFMGGSMGSVVGEKIARTMELAIAEDRACITIAATGGARMQEATFSLMQLPKTCLMCRRMQDKGTPFVSILTDPSTAGIMASFASLGDVIIAEPGAYVGFAGRRVIEATIRQTLPPNFQTAEFVQEHGFIDLVVKRDEMRDALVTLLRQFKGMDALLPETEAAKAAT